MWVVEAGLDTNDRYVQQDTGNNSMLIYNEVVTSMHEFTERKMIIAFDPAKIIIVEEWHFTKELDVSIEGQQGLMYMERHPEFNYREFPFLVCSGFECFMLINVKEGIVEKFIDSLCGSIRAQKSFFFLREEEGDIHSFHFARNHQTNNMLELHMWYKLPLM